MASGAGAIDAMVAELEKDLRAEGWADHASVTRELANWATVANIVNRYSMTVDDFTNDLSSRDYLELALGRLPVPAREWLSESVAPLDDRFRDATVKDDRGLLGRFFRIDQDSPWWWHRIPRAGPPADYLAGSDQH